MAKLARWPGRKYAGLILILWLAFFLRVYALADVSINNDEIYEYERWTGVSFRAIAVDDLIVNSQALTYLLDRASILLLGDRLFALRWPALGFSMLGVALIYTAGRYLFNRRVGWLSALLLAVCPYALYLAHTARGYSLVMALSVLIYFLALLALQKKGWRYWLGLSLTAAALLYTHLFTALALVNFALLAALAYRRRPRQFHRQPVWKYLTTSLVLLAVVLVLLYAPLWSKAMWAMRQADQATLSRLVWSQRPQVPASLWTSLLWFTGLEKGSFGVYTSLLFAGLVIGGISRGWARATGAKVFFLTGWALLPFLEIWLIGQLSASFWARPSYLGFTLPPLLILAALALAQLPAYPAARKWPSLGAGLALAVLLAFFWGLTIREFYRDYASGNWQLAGNFLQQNSMATDLVLCQRYDQPWRQVDIDGEDDCTRSLNYRRKADTAMVANVQIAHSVVYDLLPQANSGIINRRGRVWLLVWNVPPSLRLPPGPGLSVVEFNRFGRSLLLRADNPETYVANLATVLTPLQATAAPGPLRFVYSLMLAPLAAISGQADLAQTWLATAYANQPDHPGSTENLKRVERILRQAAPPAIQYPLAANFGGEILLQGFSLASSTAAPGDKVGLTLFWQAQKRIEQDYTVFLHLRDRAGRTVAQFDYRPFGGGYPTPNWQVGQVLAEPHPFRLPAEVPAGEYDLVIGFYTPQTMARLPLLDDPSGEGAFYLTPLVVR